MRLLSSFGWERDFERDAQRACQIILKVSDEFLGPDETSCVRLAMFHKNCNSIVITTMRL